MVSHIMKFTTMLPQLMVYLTTKSHMILEDIMEDMVVVRL
jgi:hypothetical protein